MIHPGDFDDDLRPYAPIEILEVFCAVLACFMARIWVERIFAKGGIQKNSNDHVENEAMPPHEHAQLSLLAGVLLLVCQETSSKSDALPHTFL
jgi:hypothetical protein